MGAFEDFREELREALTHLQDPDYQPSPLICVVIGCDPQSGAVPVQNAIAQAIKELDPPGQYPVGASARKNFDVLYHRFILGFTQEKTAELLQMSVRSLGRAQREATHTLGRALWQVSLARVTSTFEKNQHDITQPQDRLESEPVDWRSQLRKELSSLQVGAPGALASVPEAIHSVVQLESALAGVHHINLVVKPMPANLVASIHPSALRQILILAVAQMARCVAAGDLTIECTRSLHSVQVALFGRPTPGTPPFDSGFIQEILALQEGSASIYMEGDLLFFKISLPASFEITVLVVDDNPDMVHFYRRCTAGTRYQVIDAGRELHSLPEIETLHPDIIVLDLMLPDINGWDLLAQLHKSAITGSIPVIICSIIGEEDLAAALGAALYLPKPVLPRTFIQALDQVLHPAST
jgi:CheY-like chemotaxis protein